MRALVTGGGGFLGKAVVRRLLSGGWAVRSFSRKDYPELRAWGAETVSGDLGDPEAVAAAVDGCEAVFHAAARVGIWGRYEDFRRDNVEGTRRVIEACRRAGVRRLVFTSSPSVVFDGRDLGGVDESAPYPARFESHYSRTKALAEELVLAANGPELATAALRPHLIWGPGDPNIFPRVLEQARAGRLRRIGGADKLVDTTYIDDAAEAHWQAALRLSPGSNAAGRPYFISSGDPRPIWSIINSFLRIASLPPIERSVPKPAAILAASAFEIAHRVFRLPGEPRLTRMMVSQLSTAHWFDISAARRELGYQPRVTIEEGLRRLEDWHRRTARN